MEVVIVTLVSQFYFISNPAHFVLSSLQDEIHERDKFSDFLLISLRDLLAVNKKLKLVLMSAALDINLFREYFGDCPVLHGTLACSGTRHTHTHTPNYFEAEQL